MYCAGKLMQMAIDQELDVSDYHLVGETFKKCVN
jgi:hypothetical protein